MYLQKTCCHQSGKHLISCFYFENLIINTNILTLVEGQVCYRCYININEYSVNWFGLFSLYIKFQLLAHSGDCKHASYAYNNVLIYFYTLFIPQSMTSIVPNTAIPTILLKIFLWRKRGLAFSWLGLILARMIVYWTFRL